jgi:replicative DNA helicase
MSPKPLDTLVPPNSVEAEKCVLSGMLLNPEGATTAIGMLTFADFYRPTHGKIFEAIAKLTLRGEEVDIITVQEELKRADVLNECGGAEYLMAIISQLPSAKHTKRYAKIVKEKSVLRQLDKVAMDIRAMVHEPDAKGAYEKSVEMLLSINRDDIGNVSSLSEKLQEAMEVAESRSNKPIIHGLKTGLESLDSITLGLQPGVNIIAARPSHGKTSLALQIVQHNEVPMLMFSLETSARTIAQRMLAAKSGINSFRLRTGRLSSDEWESLAMHANELCSNRELYIYDRSVNIGQLIAVTKRFALQRKLGAVIIDYVQLVKNAGQGNREQEVATVSRGIQDLSRDLDIPVVAVAQLSRRAEQKEGGKKKTPELADLRESGQLEADANVVILVDNPKPEDDNGEERDATLIVAKQKDGPTPHVKVKWNPASYTFHDVEERYGDPRMPYAED